MKTIIIAVLILLTITFTLKSLNTTFVKEPRIQSAVKEIKIQSVKDSFASCKSFALEDYDSMWETSCLDLGMKESCLLPTQTAEIYNKALRDKNEECFDIYKLELSII